MSFQFKSNDLELEINDFDVNFSENLIEYDTLTLRIKNSLIQFIKIVEKREGNVPLNEQLKWALNSKLEKTLENYYYDFQVFKDEGGELLALAAALEKEKLDSLLERLNQLNSNIVLVTAEDKQFNLYKREVSLWQKTNLLTKFNNMVIVVGSGLLLLSLAGIILINILKNNLDTDLFSAQQRLKDIEGKITAIRLAKSLTGRIEKNQKYNEGLIDLLLKLTALLPDDLYLNKMQIIEEEKILKISGFCNNSMQFNNILINKIKKIKGIKEVNLTKIFMDGSQQNFECQVTMIDKNIKKIANEKPLIEKEKNG